MLPPKSSRGTSSILTNVLHVFSYQGVLLREAEHDSPRPKTGGDDFERQNRYRQIYEQGAC